jgi:hemerythrin-like domain-containing protein
VVIVANIGWKEGLSMTSEDDKLRDLQRRLQGIVEGYQKLLRGRTKGHIAHDEGFIEGLERAIAEVKQLLEGS